MDWRRSLSSFFSLTGMPVFAPFVRLSAGEKPGEQFKEIWKLIVIPVLAFALFTLMWSGFARVVKTKAGSLPGPLATLGAGTALIADHFEQKKRNRAEKQAKLEEAKQFLAAAKRLEARAAEETAEAKRALGDQVAVMKRRALQLANHRPSSAPTIVDQTLRSLLTVFVGFMFAALIGVPVGLVCGMSPMFNAAINPLIQIFKPVSPLAWLPVVSIVIGWLYYGMDASSEWFSQAFLVSAVTVSLCALWPTLANTALGVASVDADYLNVAKVLRLSSWQKLTKIIIPASLPLMFAGLRISLSVGWMVLVAADMLAQNPGLGKFVWDEFQNGASDTMAKIVFVVFVIGIIGFLLDRVMVCLRNLVSFDSVPSAG